MKRKTSVILGLQSLIVAGICMIICAVSVAAASELAENEMDIIWTESDGLRHEIFTSSYRAGSWGEPVQITDDNADNLHPSMDVGTDGKKWAVWTALESSGFEIRYSIYSDSEWSEVKKVPSNLANNIKPSIVVDNENIPWVIWSANNGDDDEIYYTRFINGEWMEEQCLHEDNNVPDIMAFLDIDSEGRPVASWNRFQDSGYVEVQSTWDDGSWSTPVMVEQDEDEADETVAQEDQITLPEFITDTRQVFLRAFEPSKK